MLVLLYALWLVFNARITTEILIMGVFLDVLMYLLMRYTLGFTIKKEMKYIRVLPNLIWFFIMLFLEVIKANMMVIKKILFGKKQESGEILRFTTDLKYEFTQVLFANSITLTPGTITIKLLDGYYIVHGLTKEFAEGLETNRFYQMLKKMEEKFDAK